MKCRTDVHEPHGFTLVEVMVSTVIVSVAVFAMMALMSGQTQSNRSSEHRMNVAAESEAILSIHVRDVLNFRGRNATAPVPTDATGLLTASGVNYDLDIQPDPVLNNTSPNGYLVKVTMNDSELGQPYLNQQYVAIVP